MIDSRHNYQMNVSPLSVVKNWPFKRSVSATSTISPYADYALGIDVSRYQYVNYQALKGIVDFVFCKCSQGSWWIDPLFSVHVQGFHDIGIPVMAYHYWECDDYLQYGAQWYDRIPPDKDGQLLNLLHALEHKNIYGLFMDSEQTGNPDPMWSVTALCNFMPRLDVALRNLGDTKSVRFNAGKFFFGDYSGEWHYNMAKTQYMALNAKKASNDRPYDIWSAKYPYATGAVTTTWENLKSNLLPATTAVSSLGSPNAWTFWQFSGDKFKLPGVFNSESMTTLSAVDLNFFNGTKTALYKLIGFAEGNEENPEEPPVVDTELEERVSVLETKVDKVVTLFNSWNK